MNNIKHKEELGIKKNEEYTKNLIKTGNHFVKQFPNGINLDNLMDATMKLLKEITDIYFLNAEEKKEFICDVLCYVIDNTDAGALESLDEIIKKLIPTIIDNLILVEKGKLKINKKSTKKWCCF